MTERFYDVNVFKHEELKQKKQESSEKIKQGDSCYVDSLRILEPPEVIDPSIFY